MDTLAAVAIPLVALAAALGLAGTQRWLVATQLMLACICPASRPCGARCTHPGCGGRMVPSRTWPGYVRCETCRWITAACPGPPRLT